MFKKIKNNEYEFNNGNELLEDVKDILNSITNIDSLTFNSNHNDKLLDDIISRKVIGYFIESHVDIHVNTIYKIFINLPSLSIVTFSKLENDGVHNGLFYSLVK